MSGTARPNNRGTAYAPVGNHTPHDTTAVSVPHNAIQAVDASGAVVVTNSEDVAVTMYCVQGVIYPCHVTLIKDTGTTATNFALFA